MNVPLFRGFSMVRISQVSALLLLIFLLPSCGTTTREKNELQEKNDSVIDLCASVKIVENILKSGTLSDYLEDGVSAEGVQLILHNFSPARIALEIEVLNAKKPALVLFVGTLQKEIYAAMIHRIAEEYCGLLTFFIIDSDKLFSLAQQAEVIESPTVILLKDRKEVARLEMNISCETIKAMLTNFL